MIIPGLARSLTCRVTIIASGLAKTSGTIYAYVSRDSDGFFLKADNTWASGVPAGANVPTATHSGQGEWFLSLNTTVTAALVTGDFITCVMTDNETPASATVSSTLEQAIVDAKTQTAVDALSNIVSTGAAVNIAADSFTLTTGTQVANTYASTAARDGVYHQLADAAGSLDCYYEFQVGGD